VSPFLFEIIPTVLALLFTFIWFFPEPHKLLGWGGDPYFNLWTLEQVWSHLSGLGRFGPFGLARVFSGDFWDTQIFFPSSNTLAFSENQIVLGILSWPIRVFSGNGILTLNLFAAFMSFATFFFARKYFRSLGVLRYAAWGGLLFQACGWIQDHYAHYQNICIFLFPLALWRWQEFVKRQTVFNLLLCGFCFGFAAGWNVYFQIFLNAIFGSLFLYQFYLKKIDRRWLILLAGAVAGVELPFAMKYFEAAKLIGSMKVPTGEYIDNSANWMTFFGHCNQSSLLQHLLPFYPNFQISISKVNFLGFAWIVLWIMALAGFGARVDSKTQSKARLFAVAAILLEWAALGPNWGMMHILRLIPGFEGLRDIGRLQSLVALFSLSAILIYLEEKTKSTEVASGLFARKWPGLLFCIMILELVPGERPKYCPVPKDLYGKLTPLEVKLAENQPRTEVRGAELSRRGLHPASLSGGVPPRPEGRGFPLLDDLNKNVRPTDSAYFVVPDITPEFQMTLARDRIQFYDGYSGRIPLNSHLLILMNQYPISTEEKIRTQLIFSGAKNLMSIDAKLSNELRAMPFLKNEGCYSHFDYNVCLFSTHWTAPQDLARLRQPQIELDQDTDWAYPPQAHGHLGILKATQAGILNFKDTGTCSIETTTTYGGFLNFKERRNLLGHGFHQVEFKSGDAIIERESKQWIFSFPKAIRPDRKYRILCNYERGN